MFCILSAGPCTYNTNKFRGKPNTPVGYERLTTVSFRPRMEKPYNLFRVKTHMPKYRLLAWKV